MKFLKRLTNTLLIAIVLLIMGWQLWQQQQQPTATRPGWVNAQRSAPQSQTWQVVKGSVYDGDTLRVRRGVQELKIRFCGIDAPEKNQPRGIESRDYLRSLIAKGDGSVILIPIEKDRYGQMVAEVFIRPRPGQGYSPEQELYLNGEMVQAGLAYHYERYSGNCENRGAIAAAEEIAQNTRAGVWSDPNAVKPWEWRQAGQ